MRLSLLAVAFSFTLIPAAGQTAPRRLRELSTQFEQLAERVDPAVVQIVTRGLAPSEENGNVRLQRGGGSGFLVDPSGYIVTNAHVVGTSREIQVLVPQPADDSMPRRSVIKPNGKLVPARVLGTDRETDLAILKIEESNLPFLQFGESEDVRAGELVFAFGSPFGLENSVTMGVVSSVARQIRPDDPMIYIQTDASINPGNSGGPLINADGAVVGVNTFILSNSGGSEGIGFSIPSSIARRVYQQIREHGRVRRGQIGVLAQTITPELAQALSLTRDWGVILTDVVPQGPAEAAGLEIKDVILTLNGKPMENARQFGVNIYQNAGETIQLEILRGGKKMAKGVAVLERPSDPDRMLSLAAAPENRVEPLNILALPLDANVSGLLPPLRRLSGVVVAARIGDPPVENSLRAGDVIYEVNNQKVSQVDELRRAIAGKKHGEVVAILVERLGQIQFVMAEID
jgi:serine protease Do